MTEPDPMLQMAFPAIGDYNGGVCPESHPVAIVSVFTEFFYNTRQVKDSNRWVYSEGDGVGYALRECHDPAYAIQAVSPLLTSSPPPQTAIICRVGRIRIAWKGPWQLARALRAPRIQTAVCVSGQMAQQVRSRLSRRRSQHLRRRWGVTASSTNSLAITLRTSRRRK